MNSGERMERIICWLDDYFCEQPSLKTLAEQAQMSPSRFHREFQRWIGISPKDFVRGLAHNSTKAMLREVNSNSNSALSSGQRIKRVTPEEVQSKGAGLTFSIGHAESPFGPCSYAETKRGLYKFRFSTGRSGEIETEVRKEWPKAEIKKDDQRAKTLADRAFPFPWESAKNCKETQETSMRLWVRGTNFQFQVWKTLLQLPPGKLASYGFIAAHLNQPKASRAVGNAIGANPVAMFIPCHRVIHSTGYVQGYRWGTGRKRALIAWERSKFLKENGNEGNCTPKND